MCLEKYIRISSGLGESSPISLIVLPILFEDQVKGVLELASFQKFSQMHLYFLEQLTESIGIVLNNIASSTRTEMLLEQSQSLAVELKTQQEELRRTNEELEDKAHLLVKQKEELEQKNYEVEIARKSLEEKAAQLMITSKYKSEFLANMSHELRTPLNSLLILSQQLSENHEGNLSEKQIRFSKTINSCGNDLVNLINDILDLSKIESGVISVDNTYVSFSEIVKFVELTFRHMADYKKMKFEIEEDVKLPEFIETDEQRLKQILKNLLSNAFKFTEKGKVTLSVFVADKKKRFDNLMLDKADTVIGFRIQDTGIGISNEKQHIIFEAFQQAEGSTSRKFGGTGLGLSISRGLTSLLGGSMELDSELDKGSTFILYLPLNFSTAKHLPGLQKGGGNSKKQKEKELAMADTNSLLKSANSLLTYNTTPEISKSYEVEDDRQTVKETDKVVLMVVDEAPMARLLKKSANKHGFKAVVSNKGGVVFDLVSQYTPCTIVLDLNLRDVDGWKVLNRLKNDLNTRSIPVALTSVGKEDINFAFKLGAYQVLNGKVGEDACNGLFKKIKEYQGKKTRQILIVKESKDGFEEMAGMLKGKDVKVLHAPSGADALRLLEKKTVDCAVVDMQLPDFNGTALIAQLEQKQALQQIPLIVYSEKNLEKEELAVLRRSARGVIMKSDTSLEKLLELTSFYLHRNYDSLPKDKSEIIKNMHPSSNVMKGKKVLLVDDDIRNIFALVSALEGYGLDILSAESGKRAIELMNETPDIDIILMDIMMPEMDGFETMQLIRQDDKNKNIPIIAVTAKAMKGDREKCLEAGASDYITKPLDMAQLVSIMRIWLNEY